MPATGTTHRVTPSGIAGSAGAYFHKQQHTGHAAAASTISDEVAAVRCIARNAIDPDDFRTLIDSLDLNATVDEIRATQRG